LLILRTCLLASINSTHQSGRPLPCAIRRDVGFVLELDEGASDARRQVPAEIYENPRYSIGPFLLVFKLEAQPAPTFPELHALVIAAHQGFALAFPYVQRLEGPLAVVHLLDDLDGVSASYRGLGPKLIQYGFERYATSEIIAMSKRATFAPRSSHIPIHARQPRKPS
jgi:hypothetical protein